MNIDGKYQVIGDRFGKCLTKANGKESEPFHMIQASPRIN